MPLTPYKTRNDIWRDTGTKGSVSSEHWVYVDWGAAHSIHALPKNQGSVDWNCSAGTPSSSNLENAAEKLSGVSVSHL